MKYLLPLLILINCNEIKGVFEWTVVGKVTDYGQNVTLFCHVPNCCPKDAGWDRWTPQQRTLFIDVKSGRPNKKYDGKVAKDGYTLIIQNLTKNDLNVSYSCLYGVTLGEQKFLLAEDVFTYMSNAQPNEGQIAGLIVGAIVLIAVALSVALFVFYSWRRRKKNKFGYQVANVDEPLVIKDKSISKKDISNISCKEGECVVFTYHSESRNKSIKWLKAGRQNVEKEHWKVFHDDRQYTFELKNTQTSDNGEYCVQVGKFVRKRFYLNTKVYFVDDPSDFECAEGDDAIFTCKVLPDNTPVKLLKGDKGFIEPEKYMISQKSSDEKGKVYELKLMNIQPSDDGKYCVQAGNSFRDVHLKVKVHFVDGPSDLECAEGDDAIFTCTILTDNTPVKLLKGDKGIIAPEKTKITNKSSDDKGHVYELKLMNIQPSDDGKYCVQVGNSFRDVQLKVKVYFVDGPSNIECAEGDHATFTCKILTDNTPVKLLKGDKGIIVPEKTKITNESSDEKGHVYELKLMNIQPSDDGKYCVQVGNSFRDVQLKVKVYFVDGPSDLECAEGDDATFTCKISTDSTPVKLLKGDKGIIVPEKTKITNKSSDEKGHVYELKLMNIQPSDDGKYCVQVGNSFRDVQLKVKVLFVDEPSHLECAVGDNAIFTCTVLPDSTPVKLLKGDKCIISPEKHVISSKSVDDKGLVYELKLMNIQPSDGGIYCVQVGNSFRDLQLKVKEISMDSTERNKRLERIKSGREIRKYVRIQVIGKEGVGKTSLVRRLLNKDFGKPLPVVESTNGIEIDTNCQINTRTGEWVFDKVTEKQAMIKRIKRIMQDENTKEKESETDIGQHCPFEEKFSEKETHYEPNLANKDLSGNKGKEHKYLSPDEQIDMEEEIKLESEISDNHDMKHEDIVSVDPNINLDEYEAYSTDPRTTKQSNEDVQHHVNISPENKNTFNDKTRDTKPKLILKKMDEIILDAKERENISEDLDGFVECGIWDFAGQKEYYGTHQTFFTQQAVYIIVADIATAAKESDHNNDFDSIGKYIDFWFDSIHSFCTNSGDDHLCPPIFMVFTGIDKKEESESEVSNLGQELLNFRGRKGGHLRGIYYISNTRFDPKDSEECNRLKKEISEYSNESKYFVELSTEWIQLENTLEAIKGEIHFLSYGDMEKLASKILINERNNLNAFLTYQHTIGNMIYFEDIGEFIILKPRWLVECFRCLIYDSKKRDFNVMNDLAWKSLTGTGEISTKLIKKLLQKVTDLDENEEFIIKVMEKFNIIIKPNIKSTGGDQNTDSYYIPCMIANETDVKSIKKHFIKDECKVTPWLVLEFTFLPLAYFYHILFYYIGKYKVCTIDRNPAIYKGKAVFFNGEFNKFILCLSYNCIALQIWAWDDINEQIYKYSLNELCDCIEDTKGKFSQNLSYSIKAKCRHGDISKIDGRIGWKDRNEKEKYMCNEHNQVHTKKDEDLEHTWLMHAKKREEINEEKTRILTNATEEEHSALKETIKKMETEQGEVILMNIREEEENSALKEKIKKMETEQGEVIQMSKRDEEVYSALKEKIKKMETEQGEVIPMNIREEEENFDLKEEIMKIETEQGEVIPMIIREEEEYSDLKEKIKKRETELEEVIPKNIRDQIHRQIKDWEKKDKMFVSTRASDYVIECVQDNSCVTLTGPLGVGKSFIARHTALVLQKEGYQIIPVIKPDDIRKYYQTGKQTVFIVDDICGNFTANQRQIDNWVQLLRVINMIMADESCKIIVSCRLQVYKDYKFNILSPFKSCECNLISDKLGLTSVEKNAIAKTYIGSTFDDIDKLSQNSEFFPLLCSLYQLENDGDVKEFFKNPCFVYQNELDSLSRHGYEGDYKICSLALLVLFNNQLKDKWFQGDETREQRHLIDAVGTYRGISKATLKEALLTLEGTFVRYHDGIYRTVHDTLFDFLVHYFGQKMIECLINHGDSDLVHERFIWRQSIDEKSSNIDFIIQIPDDYFEFYLERFMKDWSTGKVTVAFNNKNMKESQFRQLLLEHLYQLNKSIQMNFANTTDTVIPSEYSGSGNTPLILTCCSGYTDIVQWMLYNDVDVNQCRDDGTTGLIMASSHGHTGIVQLLLEKNPNVDLCDKDGCSPLYMASKDGHTDIVKLLLTKNPDVDLCDKDGLSASKMASQNGHTDIVKLLSRKSYSS